MTLKEYKIQKALGLLNTNRLMAIIQNKATPIDVLLAIKEEYCYAFPTPVGGKLLHMSAIVHVIARTQDREHKTHDTK